MKNRCELGITSAAISLVFTTCCCGIDRLDASEKRTAQESRIHYPRYPEGLSPERREDLQGNISAERRLSPQTLDLIIDLSDYLIDQRNSWVKRSRAARDLGHLGHKLAIPALLAVLRDERENDKVRQEAARALSMILDKRVVRHLIKDGLGSDSETVQLQTWESLPQLAGSPPQLFDPSYRLGYKYPPKDKEELKEYLKVWLDWWEARRDITELSRTNRSHF